MSDDTDRTSARAARGFSTRAIQAASRAPHLDQVPTSVPIYQTATFTAADADALGDVLGDPRSGYAYSRIGNPTTAALGAAYAELAGGELGTAFSSGMGAIHAAIASRVRSGDRIVASRDLYGSTRSLLLGTFGRFGVQVDLVDITDHEAVDAALAVRPTAVLFAESIANPTTIVADHARLAELAHRHGAAYLVDNTFASPYVCRPLELGTDLVIESATKFLGGHSDVIAGVVAGSAAVMADVDRVQVDTGGTLGPLEAFLVLRGILTLGVRAERHSRTAAALAAWLETQAGVTAVRYPGLASHPQHDVAVRQFRTGAFGGMLALDVVGGRDAGKAVIDAMSLPELTASLGSVHTMVVHPPSTSQRQLSDAALQEAGITAGLLRVSVGLEDLEDLQADFSAALDAARRVAPAPAAV